MALSTLRTLNLIFTVYGESKRNVFSKPIIPEVPGATNHIKLCGFIERRETVLIRNFRKYYSTREIFSPVERGLPA